MGRILSVYCVTNAANGKKYIGITVDPDSRWWEHKNKAKNGGGFALHQAIRKYGENNFIFEIICCTKNREDLKQLEIMLIEEYNTSCFTGHGYNMTKGGDNSSSIGTCTARETSTGKSLGRVPLEDPRWSSGEIVPANLGHRHSEISKKRMSEAALEKSKGALNSNAKLFKLTSPEGETFVLSGILRNFCKEMGLKYSALYDYIGKGPVPKPSKYHKNASTDRWNTVGWSLHKV